MTEKEAFLNMIHRVLAEKEVAGEELDNYCYENDNCVTIINANLEETFFYFDENGTLIFYE